MPKFRRHISVEADVAGATLTSRSHMRDEYHDLELDLTIDLAANVITACAGRMHQHPYQVCPGALASLQRVVGLHLTPGVKKAYRHAMPKAAGCAHFTELFENTFDFLMQKLYWDGVGLAIENRAEHEKLLFGFLNQSDTCFAFNRETGFSPEPSEFLPPRTQGDPDQGE